MSYADIEKGIAALGQKAKNNDLALEDMDGGTFTIRYEQFCFAFKNNVCAAMVESSVLFSVLQLSTLLNPLFSVCTECLKGQWLGTVKSSSDP